MTKFRMTKAKIHRVSDLHRAGKVSLCGKYQVKGDPKTDNRATTDPVRVTCHYCARESLAIQGRGEKIR